jgi:hypothetical protein
MRFGERFRSWAGRRRAGGASASGVVRELPGKLLRKGSDAVLQGINRLAAPLYDKSCGMQLERILAQSGNDPYVLVLVPRILHYVIPCLTLARRRVPVVVVCNGAWDWEIEALQQRFPGIPLLPLRPVRGSMLPHGVVLDLLLRHATRNFTLLDPDLLVFDPDVFDELKLRDGEIACGAYGFTNSRASLTFPTTHLLALDVPRVRELMASHDIRPVIYNRTPPHLVEPLRSLGLGDHNFPKDYLSFYDPLNLLLAMAAYEGLKLRVLHREEAAVYHVGGVSYLEQNVTLDYFNARLMEQPFAKSFRERYRRPLFGSRDPASAREWAVNGGAEKHLEGIDRTVERIAEVLSPD